MKAQLGDMTQKLHSESFDEVAEAASYFRRLSSIEEDPPLEDIVARGVVSPLICLLWREDSPQVQFDAAWALCNIASGTSEDTRAVVDNGAVGPLVQLLRSRALAVREQAVWALGNIAGDCADLRDVVLEAGALPHVLDIMQSNVLDLSTRRTATWTLSNFCRGRQTEVHLDMVLPALPTLADVVQSQDVYIVIDSCWALSYISMGTPRHVNAVLELGVLGRLAELAGVRDNSPMANARLPALRTIGNAIAGDHEQAGAALQANALPALLRLATNSTRRLFRKEACWTLRKLTASTIERIDLVIESGGVHVLLGRLRNDDASVGLEACWAIHNALVCGELRHAERFVEAGVVHALVEVLEGDCQPVGLMQAALQTLERILNAGEKGTDRRGAARSRFEACFGDDVYSCLEALQHHEANTVHKLVVNIMSTYFSGAIDDQGGAPLKAREASQPRQQQFSSGEAPPEHGTLFSDL